MKVGFNVIEGQGCGVLSSRTELNSQKIFLIFSMYIIMKGKFSFDRKSLNSICYSLTRKEKDQLRPRTIAL